MSDPSSDASPLQPPVRRTGRSWLRLAGCVLLAYILWCAGLYLVQDRLLFRTDMVPALTSADTAWGEQAVHIRLDLEPGQQVQAWFFPAPGAHEQRPAPVAVFFHGNAERIEQGSWFVRGYRELGFSVLLPEYRGYGQSAGKPSEAGIVADAVRFYDALVQRPDVDPTRILFHGRSLGGGVAAQLAARRKPAALILECTFTSAASFAHQYFAPMMLAKNPFRTDEVLPNLDSPVFIAHGSRDTIVPVEHGRRLRKLARHATYIEYECGHNDLPPGGREAEHWARIAAFLRHCDILPRPCGP